MKYNTSVTDPSNNKALTAWNDSMITHGSSLNPAQVHDPCSVKKSLLHDIYFASSSGTCFIILFPLSPSLLIESGIICTAAHMVLDL